jgi:predicted component of viral defense system (DUF524 family)
MSLSLTSENASSVLEGPRFWSANGERLDTPEEWREAFIEIPMLQVGDVGHVGLLRKKLWNPDENLELVARVLNGQVRVLAAWPKSGTGRYTLRLQTTVDGYDDQQFSFTIDPKKISPSAFQRLIERLEAQLPFALALALRSAGALAGVKQIDDSRMTVAQELERLRTAVGGGASIPGMATILPSMARDPHDALVGRETWVAAARARRVSPAAISQSTTRPLNLRPDGSYEHLLDTVYEPSFDVYENQVVKAYCQQIQSRLARLLRVAPHLEQEVTAIATEFRRARKQAAFLDDVSTLARAPSQVTMVQMKVPTYRDALSSYLEFRKKPDVSLVDAALDAPLENLPDLYQHWAALELLVLLVETATECGFTVDEQNLVHREVQGLQVKLLREGVPVLRLRNEITGLRAEATLQKSFGVHGSLRSISFRQVPDVTLQVIDRDERPSLFLFDPKYKLDSDSTDDGSVSVSPKKEDIDKMHSYRDAIRTREGSPVVEYAAILYPGPHVAYGESAGAGSLLIEALPFYPGREHELQEKLKPVLERALTGQ